MCTEKKNAGSVILFLVRLSNRNLKALQIKYQKRLFNYSQTKNETATSCVVVVIYMTCITFKNRLTAEYNQLQPWNMLKFYK